MYECAHVITLVFCFVCVFFLYSRENNSGAVLFSQMQTAAVHLMVVEGSPIQPFAGVTITAATLETVAETTKELAILEVCLEYYFICVLFEI